MTRIEPTPEKNAVPSPESVIVAAGEAPPVTKKAVMATVARGIAQSGSYSARKRMISFSPERSPRPENLELALRKREKNLKATEKLQQRLEGTPSKTPTRVTSNAGRMMTSPSPMSVTARRSMAKALAMASPATAASHVSSRRASPAKSPTTAASNSIPISQTMELTYEVLSQPPQVELETEEKESTVFQSQPSSALEADPASPIVAPEDKAQRPDDEPTNNETADDIPRSQETVDREGIDVLLSQNSVESEVVSEYDSMKHINSVVLAESQANQSEMQPPVADGEAAAPALAPATSWSEQPDVFTSTSLIEDVGLFNCETDVEFTGGVYGEGTDGKVCAAVINGQKVALKRAKPHEGFPDDEAKRRSAVELHYLRKVRHMKGFLQCLGLCDGIEHTCIALEVMDCKLSDYLRSYGVGSHEQVTAGSKKRHRRFTLPTEDARAMLKQICLPMITLHEHVNVAHGDLACRNILLRTPPKGYEKSWAPDVKLSDFGRIKLPSSEPKVLEKGVSFFKNCDVGSFGREILYRLLVGEIVPPSCLETRSLPKNLSDVVVTNVPDDAKQRLGSFYRLFMRCTGWGVRPTFREIYEHLDDLEYFETSENDFFPLKPVGDGSTATAAALAAANGSETTTPTPPGFLSPVAAGRPSSSASKLQKSTLDSTPHGPNRPGKTVYWLKTRSVQRGGGNTNANASMAGAPSQTFTPNGRQLLMHKKKKTPPSASATGASRRALQIVNQIQKQQHQSAAAAIGEPDKKKARKSM